MNAFDRLGEARRLREEIFSSAPEAVARDLDLEVQALLSRHFDVPAELASLGLASPAACDGDPRPLRLDAWLRQRAGVGCSGLSEIRSTLETFAMSLDVLARSPFQLLVYSPRHWAVGHDGSVLVDWAVLRRYLRQTTAQSLATQQRDERRFMHPQLLENPFPADLDHGAALRWSFALTLLRLFVSVEESDLPSLRTHLEFLRARVPTLSPELPYLFYDVFTAPVVRPAGEGACRRLLEEVLAVVEDSGPSPAAVTIAHDGYSVPGVKKHGLNEDVRLVMPIASKGGTALGVADGVSTADLGRGMDAAGIVEREFQDAIRAGAIPAPDADTAGAEAWIRNFVKEANSAVVEEWTRRAAKDSLSPTQIKHPMKSTLVLAIVARNAALIGSVGDSTAWRFVRRTRRMVLLTVPNSMTARTLKDGPGRVLDLDDEEGRRLTSVIGQGVWNEAKGRYEPRTPEPGFLLQRFEPGDLLVLASDGLSECLDANDGFARAQLLAAAAGAGIEKRESARQLAHRLVRLAEDQRSDDNITAQVVQFLAPPAGAPARGDSKESRPRR